MTTTSNPTGFTDWLLGYQRAGTARGDLARAISMDNDWPGDVDIEELREHLRMVRIDDVGMEALDRAWYVFMAARAAQRGL